MMVDAPNLTAILVKSIAHADSMHSTFTLRVLGKFGSETPDTTLLDLPAYTAGVDCSSFGQAKAAVVETGAGNTALLTTAGVFTVAAGQLKIGCEDCASLVHERGTQLRSAATSPGWDLRLVGSRVEALSYDDDGSLFVMQKGRCLRIPVAGAVTAVDTTSCSGAEVVPPVASSPGRPLAWTLRAPGRTSVLKLRAGACT